MKMLLSPSHILEQGWGLYKKGLKLFTKFSGLVIIMQILGLVISLIVMVMLAINFASVAEYAEMSGSELSSIPGLSGLVAGLGVGGSILIVLVLAILVGLISIWVNLCFIRAAEDIATNHPDKTVFSLFGKTKKQIWRSILASLLISLIVGGLGTLWILLFVVIGVALTGVLGGFLIAIGIIGGLILFVWLGSIYFFPLYEIVIGNTGVMESLKNSKKLFKGRFWKIFGRLLFLGVIVMLIGLGFSVLVGILTLIFGAIFGLESTATTLFNIIINLFPLIFLLPYTTCLYYILYKSAKDTVGVVETSPKTEDLAPSA